MSIQVVDGEQGLRALEREWKLLEQESPSPCFFTTFDYTRLVWDGFKAGTDRLLVLAVRRGPELLGIVPLKVSRAREWGIPVRVIEFIAAWDGDRPIIPFRGDEASVWEEAYGFLARDFKGWEILVLMEQAPDSPARARLGIFPEPAYAVSVAPETVSYFISLSGTWEDYLQGRGAEVRHSWKKRSRRLSELPQGFRVDCVEDGDGAAAALERYVAIEQRSWKKAAGLGVGQDAAHRAFYGRLLREMAEKGQASVRLLRSGEQDIAGWILFKFRGVVYGRETVYDPAYSSYSPGTIVHAETLKTLFGSSHRELDLLGMRETEGTSRQKLDWATGKRETVRIRVYRRRGRLRPLLFARAVLGRLR